jgi:hypothetical protein
MTNRNKAGSVACHKCGEQVPHLPESCLFCGASDFNPRLLTPKVVKKLVAGTSFISASDFNHLHPHTAGILKRYESDLDLDAVESLTTHSANALSQRHGNLSLNPLQKPSAAIVSILARTNGGLRLAGVHHLSRPFAAAPRPEPMHGASNHPNPRNVASLRSRNQARFSCLISDSSLLLKAERRFAPTTVRYRRISVRYESEQVSAFIGIRSQPLRSTFSIRHC